MSSIYSYLPTVSIPAPSLSGISVNYGKYIQQEQNRANVTLNLSDLATDIYRDRVDNKRDGTFILSCSEYGGGASGWRNAPREIRCMQALQKAEESSSVRLSDQLDASLQALGNAFCSHYNQRVEAIVERALGNKRAALFKKNYANYQIGSVSFPPQNCSADLQKLYREGEILMGTSGAIPPEYEFTFANGKILGIHKPFVRELIKREVTEENSFFQQLLEKKGSKEDMSAQKIEYDVFSALVTYIYTGKIEGKATILPKLEALAEQFKMSVLKERLASLPECQGQYILDLVQGENGFESRISSLKGRLITPLEQGQSEPTTLFRERLETLLPELEEFVAGVDRSIPAPDDQQTLAQTLVVEVDRYVQKGLQQIQKNFAEHSAACYTLAGWRKVYSLPNADAKEVGAITVKIDPQNAFLQDVNRQGEALFGNDFLYERDFPLEINGVQVKVHSQFCTESLKQREGDHSLLLNGKEANGFISEEIVEGIIEYLYKGKIQTSIEKLVELHSLATAFSFPNLKQELLKNMKAHPASIKNALEMAIAVSEKLVNQSVANGASEETLTAKIKRTFTQILDPIMGMEKGMVAPLLEAIKG